MTPLFPDSPDAAAFDAVRLDDARLSPGVEAVLARHGLAGEDRSRFPEGSLPVYAVGAAHVLKLYPPCYAFEAGIERAALLAAEGRLPIPTPRVVAFGELDGWAYLVMSRLRGTSLAAAWPHLSAKERDRVFEGVGAALASLHAIPADRVAVPRPDWAAFVAEQTASAVLRQKSRGLADAWLEQIPAFLARESPPPRPGVLLHTEVMREHLLVQDGADGWRLSGLFDFEPSMVGAADYEFASVGVFVTCGDAAGLRRLLLAYGTPSPRIDSSLSRRSLAYALLHKYSNLVWYSKRVPPPRGADTLEDLAEAWFSTGVRGPPR